MATPNLRTATPPVTAMDMQDDRGQWFAWGAQHIVAVTRDAGNNLLTMTITDGTTVRKKTITRDGAGLFVSETAWEVQT